LWRVEGERGFRGIERDVHRRHRLEIAAMVAGLEPDALHLVGDPLRCRLAVLRPGAAALEGIVGNRLVARRKVGGVDVGRGVRMARILGERGRGDQRSGQCGRKETRLKHVFPGQCLTGILRTGGLGASF
jgi:hypothetical protein